MPISDDLCNVGCVEKIKFFKEGGAKKGTDLKKKTRKEIPGSKVPHALPRAFKKKPNQ